MAKLQKMQFLTFQSKMTPQFDKLITLHTHLTLNNLILIVFVSLVVDLGLVLKRSKIAGKTVLKG